MHGKRRFLAFAVGILAAVAAFMLPSEAMAADQELVPFGEVASFGMRAARASWNADDKGEDDVSRCEYVNLMIVHTWVDAKDFGGKHADGIPVQVLQDGKPFGDPVVLDEGNNWIVKVSGCESGHKYSVKWPDGEEGYDTDDVVKSFVMRDTDASGGSSGWAGSDAYNVYDIYDTGTGGSSMPGIGYMVFSRSSTSKEILGRDKGYGVWSTTCVVRKLWFDDDREGHSRPEFVKAEFVDTHSGYNKTVTVYGKKFWTHILYGVNSEHGSLKETTVLDGYESKLIYNFGAKLIVNIPKYVRIDGGFRLPSTGGAGIGNVLLVGCILACGSGLALLNNRARRREDA